MKPILRLSLLLGVILGTNGCSTIGMRIDEKAPVFYSLDADTRAKVARGEVDLGYTPDMVYIARGEPDAKRQRVSAKATTETWTYWSYSGYDDMLMGCWGGGFYGGRYYRHGYGGYQGGHWPRVYRGHGRHHDDTRVTFKDGRVVTIDEPKQ